MSHGGPYDSNEVLAMNCFRVRVVLIGSLALHACAPAAPPESAVREPTPAAPATVANPLDATIADLVRPYEARAGVAYRVIETGETYALRGTEPFPMASTYKFPMALTWLEQVDAGRLSLDEKFDVRPEEFSVYHSPLAEAFPSGGSFTLRELLHWLMVKSDNTACDVLLARRGGPRAVTEHLRRFGIEGISVDRSEVEMAVDLLSAARPGSVTARDRAFLNALDQSLGPEEREAYFLEYQQDSRDRATPLAMVELLTRFQRGELLSPASTTFLRGLMAESRSRIAAKLPAGTPVANKTGTGMGSFNDVGIVTLPDGRHVALAVYVSGARGADQEGGEAIVADIARAAYDDVTGRRR